MTLHVKTKYKDTVFRALFLIKENLLSLYNALNESDYDNPDDLEIVTLENAIYMSLKNDNAFIIHDYLNLYEHQSTFNPNMPLRDLIYIARELEPLLQNDSIYSSRLLKIPTPRFVVFYNGLDPQPERRTLKLSDAFKVPDDDPELELRVTMLNINPGCNKGIMEHCQVLMDYMQYVATVRYYTKDFSIEEAVPRAVDECIEKGILKDFLLRKKAEVVAMSIFEYNEEEELRKLRASERRGAYEEGYGEGYGEGYDKAALRTKVESVFELLEEYGTLPEDLKKKISLEQDKRVLSKWLKLAARVNSIEEFSQLMDGVVR